MSNFIEMFDEKIRSKILKYFIKRLKNQETNLNYIEIGTAFSLNEGLSTLLAAWSIDQYFNSGKVISIDISDDNIKKSKAIVQKFSPNSLKHIEYYTGTFKDFYLSNSLNGQKFNLVFIDGSGDAMINLIEFDTLLKHIHDSGVIVIDDARFMKKTTYTARRDFGKANLIYPLLLISENLEYFMKSNSLKNKLITPNFLDQFFSDSFLSQKVKEYAAYEFIRVESSLIVFKKDYAIKYLPNVIGDLDYLNLKFSSLE